MGLLVREFIRQKKNDRDDSMLNDHHLLVTRKSFRDSFADGNRTYLGAGGVFPIVTLPIKRRRGAMTLKIGSKGPNATNTYNVNDIIFVMRTFIFIQL